MMEADCIAEYISLSKRAKKIHIDIVIVGGTFEIVGTGCPERITYERLTDVHNFVIGYELGYKSGHK